MRPTVSDGGGQEGRWRPKAGGSVVGDGRSRGGHLCVRPWRQVAHSEGEEEEEENRKRKEKIYMRKCWKISKNSKNVFGT